MAMADVKTALAIVAVIVLQCSSTTRYLKPKKSWPAYVGHFRNENKADFVLWNHFTFTNHEIAIFEPSSWLHTT